MSPEQQPQRIVLTRQQVETGILMYLKEVYGILFEQVVEVKFPVYTTTGDVTTTVTVRPQPGHGAGI